MPTSHPAQKLTCTLSLIVGDSSLGGHQPVLI